MCHLIVMETLVVNRDENVSDQDTKDVGFGPWCGCAAELNQRARFGSLSFYLFFLSLFGCPCKFTSCHHQPTLQHCPISILVWTLSNIC